MHHLKFALCLFVVCMVGCEDSSSSNSQAVKSEQSKSTLTADVSINATAYIPPQCFTDPVADGVEHNPCYVCHTPSKEPNFLNDIDVQLSYVFPESGLKNKWDNIFKDRSEEIKAISDESIISYVRTDNYFNKDGEIAIKKRLESVPDSWDRNKNGRWDGFIPDVYFNFDDLGFDHDPKGAYTGWRVYAYYPFPGAFLPTNGATDDVMMRLPEAFRNNEAGDFDLAIYRTNFAILESLMNERDVTIPPVDETYLKVDLDKDGKLAIATNIKYEWDPRSSKNMSYVGMARVLLEKGDIHLAARLLPEGTEFLHSVRYIDIDGDQTKMATRMKELRYSRKNSWRNYYQLRTIVTKETKERHDFPERTKVVIGNMEDGMNTPHGWTYQGFIEDAAGDLRPQTYEETFACLGCHGYVGASNDTTISFTRKFKETSYKEGWYHWSERGVEGIADPIREDGHGEYAYYLQHNPTGNEYRDNEEVLNKFFTKDGQAKAEMFEQLKNDISVLLMPTSERAIALNKAYKVIVDEQSYRLGREPVLNARDKVLKEVELEGDTGITEILSYY